MNKNDTIDLAKVSNIINSAKNTRSLFEPKWYVNYEGYENNHFVVWLPDSKQIQRVPIRGNKFFNQIPEITKQVDTRVNMILSTEVIPVVYPVSMDAPSTYWAKKIGDYLMHVYDKWFFNGVLHDAVHDAIVQPVSYFQLLPPETNDGKMEILELDVFNVYHAGNIKDVQSPECMYIGKDSKIPVEEIHNNQAYDKANRMKVKGETGTFSSSTYKDIIMSERFTDDNSSEKETRRAIVDELWMKEYQSDGKIKVRVITVCENMILRNELTPYNRLPFVSLKLHQGLLYQPSFVETKLPINRSIDLMQARVEDMALKMVRGALLAQYGSNITRTTNQDGEIVYYKLSKPDIMPVPEVPPFFLNMLNMNYSLMERYGSSAVTMGASPKGVKTYRTVEAIRQQDYASIKTEMDFMKIALTQLFNLVIYFASMYYLEPVGVKIYERENFNVFDVLGERGLKHNMDLFHGAQGDMTKAPAVISPKNVVQVEFESAQSYTMEGKRQTIFQAVQAGLLSKEDAIRMLKLGNVRDIIDNLEKQAQADAAKQAQQAQAQQQPGQATPQGGGQPGGTTNSQVPKQAIATPKKQAPQQPMLPGIRVGQ